jgi:YVTN family beta-propeller protein
MHVERAAFVALISCSSCAMNQPPARTEEAATVASARIPIERLVPDAVFEVPGAPDWIAIDEDVWISNEPKNSVTRLDPRTNRVAAVVPVGKQPGAGLAAGFGSLWVPNCGDSTLARVDLRTNEITKTIPMTFADSEGGIAVGAGAVWIMTDARGYLARLDPSTNAARATIKLPSGSFAVAFGEGAVFVTSTEHDLLSRVDPGTNTLVKTIPVGKKPRFLAIGEGSVWTLNQGDGSVSRVDIATNELVATIEARVPGGGGEIAVGEGSVWVTMPKNPITRIDPKTNRVVQQFFGPGGDAIRVGHGSVWLSNLHQHNVWRLDPRKIEATRVD